MALLSMRCLKLCLLIVIVFIGSKYFAYIPVGSYLYAASPGEVRSAGRIALDKDEDGPYAEFKFLINNPRLCTEDSTMRYIIYIPSHPIYFQKRMLLRNTWANTDFLAKYNFKRVFFVGQSSENSTFESLKFENDIHHDIIQANFEDSYKNLTLKAVVVFKWISRYCNKAQFVFKIDDDVHVNIPGLAHVLYAHREQKRIVIGYRHQSRTPILRYSDNCMKWCVADDVFPGEKLYPLYCSGLFYGFSVDIVEELYALTKRVPMFWIDDVYLTGILVKELSDVRYLVMDNTYSFRLGSEFLDKVMNDIFFRFTAVLCGNRCAEIWERMSSRMHVNGTGSFIEHVMDVVSIRND